jgi:HEAT repeat protein
MRQSICLALALGLLPSFAPAQTSNDDVIGILRGMGIRTGNKEAQQRKELVARGRAAIPALIEALKDSDHQVRSNAMEVMTEMGPAAADAVPALISMLSTSGTYSGWDESYAKISLTAIGPAAVDQVSVLLSSRDPKLRKDGAEILGHIGARTNAKVPSLAAVSKDPDVNVRAAAMTAIGSTGGMANTDVEPLLAGLKDLSPGVRESAALALTQVRSKDPRVIAALKVALSDDYPPVVHHAAAALNLSGDPAAMAAAKGFYRRNSLLKTFADIPIAFAYAGLGIPFVVAFILIEAFAFYRLFKERHTSRFSGITLLALIVGVICDLPALTFQLLMVGYQRHQPSIPIFALALLSISLKIGLYSLHLRSVFASSIGNTVGEGT